MSRRGWRHDESGAVAIVAAASLLTMVLVASFVIDLGFLRTDRMASQTVADMAATAAIVDFDPTVAGDAVDACESALAFAAQNLDSNATPVATSGSCATTFAGYSCPSLAPDPADVVYTAGPYTITIVHPIPDSGTRYDRFMSGQAADATFDGAVCDRFGVEVTRTRELFFRAGPSQTTRSAVALTRLTPGDEDYASLILLHRGACESLLASGNGTVIDVKGAVHGGDYYPGVITVDAVHPNTLAATDPFRGSACATNNEIIATNGIGATIRADDHIYSHQLFNDPLSTHVYSTSPPPSPLPEPGPKSTRRSVDHLYNCLSTYPAAPLWSPNHGSSVSVDSGKCNATSTRPPYVQRLVDAYQGLTLGSLPADWAVIGGTGAGVDYPDASCNNVAGTYGPAATKPAGKSGRFWFINCTGAQGLRPDGLTFEGVDAVVTYKKINTQGALTVTGHADRGAILYVQREGIENTNSDLTFSDTLVYVNEGAVTSNGGDVVWHAPRRDQTGCSGYTMLSTGAPPAACFAPIGLWTNAQLEHTLIGNGYIEVAGSFFTPNAVPFKVGGSGAQDLTRAQFYSGQLEARGGGTLTMITDPTYNVPNLDRTAGLIR